MRIVGVNQALSTAALGLNSSFINVGLAMGAAVGGLFIDQIGVESLTWLGVGGTILSLFVFGLSWMMENRQRTLASAT